MSCNETKTSSRPINRNKEKQTKMESTPEINSSETTTVIPKGRNVSNRPWKAKPQKRASHLKTATPQNNLSKTWQQKQLLKQKLLETKAKQEEMIQEKKNEILLRKERRLENERRRMENEFKAASSSAKTLGKNADLKLKSMNKKQLRQIKKTRMNVKTGVVEYVPAYTK